MDKLQWSSVEELATGGGYRHLDQHAAAVAVRCACLDAPHDGALNDISTTDVCQAAHTASWAVWMEKMAANIFKDCNTEPSRPSQTGDTQLAQPSAIGSGPNNVVGIVVLDVQKTRVAEPGWTRSMCCSDQLPYKKRTQWLQKWWPIAFSIM